MTIKSAPKFDELLSIAHRLADASATAIRPYFRMPIEIDNKADGKKFDPVTIADRNAEKSVRDLLQKELPQHGIVGEEFKTKPAEGDYCWIVDPIDGTRAFIMGYPLWGTLIGLTKNEVPVLGIMNQPFTGERYWSDVGSARYRGPDGACELSTRSCASLSDAVLSTTSPELFEPGFELDRFNNLKNHVRMTRYGGDCYAYCMLAAGQIDLIVEAGLQSYDIMPLIPIIERAGGCVTSWAGESATSGGRILASGDKKLHDAVLAKFLG